MKTGEITASKAHAAGTEAYNRRVGGDAIEAMSNDELLGALFDSKAEEAANPHYLPEFAADPAASYAKATRPLRPRRRSSRKG